jgi:putative photosynthetic complex assembly protein
MSTHNEAARRPNDDAAVAHPDYSLPPRVLMVIAFGLLLSILAAYAARTTDVGATRMTPGPSVEARDLKFATLADGALSIVDVERNAEIRRLAAKSDGFIKIVLRGIQLERNLVAAPLDAPLRLSRLTDGQLILEDHSTGRIITISAFGPGNRDAFAELLKAGSDG